MTKNIYSFSRGRILPQIQAWTDSLYWKSPNSDKLQYKLYIWFWLSSVKYISEIDCCIRMQIFNHSWFCMSLAIFTLVRKLNSATREGCKHDIQNCHSTLQIAQSSHIHIKIKAGSINIMVWFFKAAWKRAYWHASQICVCIPNHWYLFL